MSDTKPAVEAALIKAEASAVTVEAGVLSPKNLDEQLRMAKWALESGLLPQDVKTTAAAWLVMERGAELGFRGLAAFDFLYVVKGRVRITPDAVKAKALASGLLEDAREEVSGQGDDMIARVTVKRRGLPTAVVGEFSVTDAKKAKLWTKDNYQSYPKRMLLARARGFAYGDAFKDLTGGLQVREMFDLDPGEVVGGEAIGRRAEMPPLPPAAPDPLLRDLVGDALDTPEERLRAAAGPMDAIVEPPPAGAPATSGANALLLAEEKMSHAEADAALAAEAQSCAHEPIQSALKKSRGRPVVCPICGEEVRPELTLTSPGEAIGG